MPRPRHGSVRLPDRSGPLSLERLRGGVALVRIDHPPVNALDPALYSGLARLASELEVANDVRAVVVTSANPTVFVAGANLRRMKAEDLQPVRARERLRRAQAIFRRLERVPQPTIAAIEGHALGGGCELALALDFRLMSRGEARIGLPEASLGLVPGIGGTQRLTRLVGPARAAELMMLARRLDADEAEGMGLAIAAEDARAAGLARADVLARFPASSLRLIKTCVHAAAEGDREHGFGVELRAAVEAFASPAGREGVAAFRERRKPCFTRTAGPPDA